MTRWLITPSTVGANLRWLWRFQVVRRARRPRCCSCDRAGADVYWVGSWWCRAHPFMVPGRAVGIRPGLRRYTKRQAARLFRVPDARRSDPALDGFWRAPAALKPQTREEIDAMLRDALDSLRPPS